MSPEEIGIVSELQPDEGPTNEEMLLASCLEMALTTVLTPSGFLDFFPIDTVVTSLEPAPQLRAALLAGCAGIPMNTALKLDAQTATNILRAALEAEDTTPEEILGVFSPTECVQYLPWPDISKLLFADNSWWLSRKEEGQLWIKATKFASRVITQAIELDCLTTHELRDCLGIESLTKHLFAHGQNELLRQMAERAILLGSEDKAFTGNDLFTLIPPDLLHTFIPLDELREKVLLNIAEFCGWNSVELVESLADIESVESPTPASPRVDTLVPQPLSVTNK